MAKLTLTDLANLENQSTAIATINANNTLVENALELTLSRDGTTPNTMVTDLDMNSNQILNLPSPVDPNDPITLSFAATNYGDALGYSTAAAASATAASTSASGASTSATAAGTSATAAATSATAAATSATASATSATASATSATAAATSATQAANSVSSLKWNFESSTSMAVPASGGFRLNNATPASVTAVALSATDADGNTINTIVNTWDDSTSTVRGFLKVRKLSSSTTYALYSVTGSVTDNTTWLQVTLTYVSGNGTFSAADACDLSFDRTGDAGSGTVSGMSNHGIPVASSASAIGSSIALTDGQLIVGQTGADPLAKTITGDVTFTAAGASAVKTSVSLTTPILGVAAATSINKVAITAPASSATLTIADGKTLTASNSLTLAGADATTMTFPAISTNVGFREVPQNSQSTAYTSVLTDNGKHIFHPAADTNARTFTIDSNANVAYPIGTVLTFVNQTANIVTIAITTDTMTLAGTTTTGSRSLAQNGIATALKVSTTGWIISGSGLS